MCECRWFVLRRMPDFSVPLIYLHPVKILFAPGQNSICTRSKFYLHRAVHHDSLSQSVIIRTDIFNSFRYFARLHKNRMLSPVERSICKVHLLTSSCLRLNNLVASFSRTQSANLIFKSVCNEKVILIQFLQYF